MGPPVTAEPALCVVTKAGEEVATGEVGFAVDGARGNVSKDKVRKQDARIREKESGRTGSCVDV